MAIKLCKFSICYYILAIMCNNIKPIVKCSSEQKQIVSIRESMPRLVCWVKK